MAIYRYEAPEEGDHDGHDHRRVLSGDDHAEPAPVAEYPHLAEQFQVKSSKDNAAVGGPEATSVNDNLLLDPNAVAPEKGTAGEAYAASFVVLGMTLIGIIFAIPAINKLVMVEEEVRMRALGNMTYIYTLCSSLSLSRFLVANMSVAFSLSQIANGAGVTVKPSGDTEMKVVNGDSAPMPMNADEARDRVLHPAVLAYSSAFSAGAILSCAFFLVLPEALHMMVQYKKDDPNSEGIETESWKWGTAILGGLVFPWLIAIFSEQVREATSAMTHEQLLLCDSLRSSLSLFSSLSLYHR